MDVFSEVISGGRLNWISAILALFALFAAAQRNLFGIVRVLSVVTLLAVIYSVVLDLGSLPAELETQVSDTAMSVFLALSSIFAIWAAQDESKSYPKAIERAAWGQVPVALACAIWLQLAANEVDLGLTVWAVLLGGFMALLAGSLTFAVNWLFGKLERRLGSFDLAE
jgi:hypothetical protein